MDKRMLIIDFVGIMLTLVAILVLLALGISRGTKGSQAPKSKEKS